MQCKIKQNTESDLQDVKSRISKAQKELDLLNNEIIKILTNESSFTSEQLSKIISKKEDELVELAEAEKKLQQEFAAGLKEVNDFVALQAMIPNWRQEFESSEVSVQKMLLAKLIDSVFISRDSINVNFKFNLFDLT
jgi:TusA-related sulfurtransferase